MILRPYTVADLRRALAEGWRLAGATRAVSALYALLFALIGAGILGGLLATGRTPFVLAAAGAFMLVGPVLLAGFFGIAGAVEAGRRPVFGDVLAGYRAASPALWALALVCGLLFMIFVTDAAILYTYMLGEPPIGLDAGLGAGSVLRFVRWAGASGLFLAFMLFCISAFSVPLLCERRAGLVGAVVASVRLVFGNFGPAMLWAFVLAVVAIGSVLLLPALPLTLPWLAYASRALYRAVLPA